MGVKIAAVGPVPAQRPCRVLVYEPPSPWPRFPSQCSLILCHGIPVLPWKLPSARPGASPVPAGEQEPGVTQWGGGTVAAGPGLGTVVAGGQHVPCSSRGLGHRWHQQCSYLACYSYGFDFLLVCEV